MKEAVLPKGYTFGRKIYGPGETDIPNDLFDALVESGVLESDGTVVADEPGLFDDLSGEQIENLEAAGYYDAATISEATQEELVEVEKIGKATARKLKERAES